MKKNKGFSLVELSVVILIISLLLVFSFEGSQYFLINNQIRATNVKLNTIQKAIEMYIRRTGHLPCPSYLNQDTGLGVEECYSKTTNASDGLFVGSDIAVVTGGIPYRDLELSADMSYDSWGSKFVYSVYKPTAINIRNLDMREEAEVGTSGVVNVVNKDGSSTAEGTGSSSDGTSISDEFLSMVIYGSYLKIYENDVVDDSLVSQQVVYSVLSPGRNKNGAFEFETNIQSEIKAGHVENMNIPTTNASMLGKNVYFTSPKHGDDIVRYKTALQIITDTEMEDINCCVTEGVIDRLRSYFGINEGLIFDGELYNNGATSLDGTVTSGGEQCVFIMYNEERVSIPNDAVPDKYILKCFKYGRLGLMKYNKNYSSNN